MDKGITQDVLGFLRSRMLHGTERERIDAARVLLEHASRERAQDRAEQQEDLNRQIERTRRNAAR